MIEMLKPIITAIPIFRCYNCEEPVIHCTVRKMEVIRDVRGSLNGITKVTRYFCKECLKDELGLNLKT